MKRNLDNVVLISRALLIALGKRQGRCDLCRCIIPKGDCPVVRYGSMFCSEACAEESQA